MKTQKDSKNELEQIVIFKQELLKNIEILIDKSPYWIARTGHRNCTREEIKKIILYILKTNSRKLSKKLKNLAENTDQEVGF